MESISIQEHLENNKDKITGSIGKFRPRTTLSTWEAAQKQFLPKKSRERWWDGKTRKERSEKRRCRAQMAAFELGQLLPEEQRPLPLQLIRINDTRTDIVPNAGETFPPLIRLALKLSSALF